MFEFFVSQCSPIATARLSMSVLLYEREKQFWNWFTGQRNITFHYICYFDSKSFVFKFSKCLNFLCPNAVPLLRRDWAWVCYCTREIKQLWNWLTGQINITFRYIWYFGSKSFVFKLSNFSNFRASQCSPIITPLLSLDILLYDRQKAVLKLTQRANK